MKKLLLLAALSLSLSCCATPKAVEAASNIKIGIIDTQKIIRSSKAAIEARKVFFKDVEAKRKVLVAKEQSVKALQEELRTQAKDMSAAKRKEKVETLEKEAKELRRLKADLEEELKKNDTVLTPETRAMLLKHMKAKN